MPVPMPLPAPYGSLYARYLSDAGVAPIGGSVTRQSCRCPFHADGTPSAVAYFDTGVYYCPVCNLSISIVGFISKLTGCSYKEADIIVSEYLNNTDEYKHNDDYFSKSPTRKPEWNDLVKLSRELINQELPIVQEYLKRKRLQYETLIKAGVGFLPASKTNWNQDSLVFPYIIQGNVWGIRYRNLQGDKHGEKGTTFALWGLESIPEICSTVIVSEGETDRLTLMEMFPDIPVVSTPTCSFKPEWKREFNDITSIVCIPQSDGASNGFKKAIRDVLGEDASIIELPWKRGQLGKDVNDWAHQNNQDEFTSIVRGLSVSNTELLLTGDDLDEDQTDKEYLINGLLSPGQTVAILGPMKAKKSFTMLNMIRALIGEDPFLGLPGATSNNNCGNILIIEEEGTKEDLRDRVRLVLSDTAWRERCHFMHKKGFKLDSDRWISKLSKIIRDKEIGVVFFDCLYQMHSQNEDKAQEMGIIWRNIKLLQSQYPRLVPVIIHHFGKNGDIVKGWDAIRGSSTFGAQIDLAIFQEKKMKRDEEVIRYKFDGREISDIEDGEGNSIIECTHYVNGVIEIFHSKKVVVQRAETFYDEMDERLTWGLKDCAEFFGVSTQTIRNWVEKSNGKYSFIPPAKGRPSMIVKGS